MRHFALALLAFSLASTAHGAPHEHASTHGMLVFGTSRVYFSHLPMYHAPHDAQVLLEVELDSTAREAYQTSRENSPNALVYTFVPAPFVLSLLRDGELDQLEGDLYEGHFERGGKVIASHVKAHVEKLLLFRKLSAEAPRPENYQAFVFGSADERFMAHKITARPNFDQIVQLKPGSLGDELSEVSFDAVSDEPLTPSTPLKIEKIIYTEEGDLSI